MPTINIPDKVCPHCNGTKWYVVKVKRKTCTSIIYKCVKRVLDINKKSNCKESRKKALIKYRNTEKFKIKQTSYYNENKEKVIERAKNWRCNNKEQYLNLIRKIKNRYTNNLSDYYIKNQLIKREKHLCSSDIPEELIVIKRKQLLLKRQTA